ncbi:MAG: protein kinase [Kofleriaceae bacterium]
MPESGESIGPYRLVSQLGKGAMGEVWRARDERLDRYVALKVLPAELAGDPERRARIQREAKAAAAIRHVNVVTLYDVVDNILVMELVEGKTLSEVVKVSPPSREIALQWIQEIADALAAAHARHILHRDIKAANIMVTPDGHIKVLDFGLAKLHDDVAPIESLRMRKATGLEETQELKSYETHAGTLLGTPMYMAPEQILGSQPDERSEVFSVGVLAYELVHGKPPYKATTMDSLFEEILKASPALGESAVDEVLARALAKDPTERYASMAELRDAVIALRRPARRRWVAPLIAAVVMGAVVAAIAMWPRAEVERPGDEYVKRALEEYDVFYNDKALSSLRAALRIAPDHPRANAYMVLFGGAPESDREAAIKALRSSNDVLARAALEYAEHGAAAARDALGTPTDRELQFWAAELDYRAGRYDVAEPQYKALLASPAPQFRGRIYDHESSVLLYLDRPDEALEIGTLYRDAFPGEADAIGVYATTLAAAGKYGEAVTAAEDALRMNEGEDTLAGLGKVLAIQAMSTDRNLARAIDQYKQSLDRAGASRRPIRRAALGYLQWIAGDAAAADTVKPCLSGTEPERGMCLFVAGVITPAVAEQAATQLDALAQAATPTKPAYGSPASLATLLRAREKFFGGACVGKGDGDAKQADDAAYGVKLDFYGAYHVPLFASYQTCERAALLEARGDHAGAAALLDTARRAPGRTWLSGARSTK